MIIISSLCPALLDDTDLACEHGHLVNDSIFRGKQFVNPHSSCQLKPLMVDSMGLSLMLYTPIPNVMKNILVLHNILHRYLQIIIFSVTDTKQSVYILSLAYSVTT